MKMSASLGKSLRLPSALKIGEEAKITGKQGIVSILGSDCERTKAASLRRTLSADMSSKKWLAQHGLSSMKKIASSEEFPISSADSSSSSEGEEECEGKNELERPGQDDVWRSIQPEKEKNELERPGQDDAWRSIQSEKEKNELEKPGQFDTWSSILAQKANEDSSKLPPPYVHPLVKRTSSLSKKSLEICTESLGSETGSDGFSSYSPSETGDVEEDKEEVQQQQQQQQESQSFDWDELRVVKYSTSRKSPPRSFPPPLPSLTRGDGPSLHMHSHRENGRLVLEAVSIPSQNNFRAQRQDGRLLLTFVNSPPSQELYHEQMIDQEEDQVDEEFEEVFENDQVEAETKEEEEEEEEDEEEEEEMGIVMEPAPKLSSGVINVHRSALMMKKLMGLTNRNPTWSHKFNKGVNLDEMEVEEEEEEVATPLPQSLPPPPRVALLIPSRPAAAAASSFNAYEYFWRTKPAAVINPLTQHCPPLKNNCDKAILSNTSPKAYEQQQSVLLRGNKPIPLLRWGCKEPRRSLLIWEPNCIATS